MAQRPFQIPAGVERPAGLRGKRREHPRIVTGLRGHPRVESIHRHVVPIGKALDDAEVGKRASGHHVRRLRESFADEEDGASSGGRAEPRGERPERRDYDLCARAFGERRCAADRFLLERCARGVVPLAAFERRDRFSDCVAIVRQPDRRQRVERLEDDDHVVRPKLLVCERGQRRAHAMGVRRIHVELVEQDRQPARFRLPRVDGFK